MKFVFKALNNLNKKVLPKLSKKDPLKLTKIEQALIAYRYWVLLKSLD
ncbi:hypothetical protein I5M32_06660 [Pedobacter sp. SD-b]|uniref:SsrA-binding protein n=1 Tax=Pedobacter segetis TaxID=2793069 RepID=A0ABS1BIC9_9SPHI|nr:hypothetical protein [Pedobacter segetis]MBK0382639.1 hypothetical protein [Pedobacter segetis]